MEKFQPLLLASILAAWNSPDPKWMEEGETESNISAECAECTQGKCVDEIMDCDEDPFCREAAECITEWSFTPKMCQEIPKGEHWQLLQNLMSCVRLNCYKVCENVLTN